MARPRFVPGSTAVFAVKARSGRAPLSRYLAARLGVVEPWAIDLLSVGAVRLDGEDAGRDAVINLSSGRHRIEVRFPEAWPRHMAATPMDLDVLYEDDWLLALDKPPGTLVHPARGHLDGRTLQNGVRHRHRDLLGLPGVTIGPPHRLDKDTSGVVVFALRASAYAELARQFAAGEPRKEYLAVVDGEPTWDDATSRAAIAADPDNPGRGKLLATGGKAAATSFRVLARGAGIALLLAEPRTGRPHQIRLHAAGLGFPVLGDPDYHPRPEAGGAGRQALHAAALSFVHPAHGRRVRVTAPLPADMRTLLGAHGIDPPA